MEDIAKGAGVCLVVLVLSIHCSSQGPWFSESQISFSSYWPHTGHRLVCSLRFSTDGEHLRHSVPLYSVQGIVGFGDCMVVVAWWPVRDLVVQARLSADFLVSI